MEAAAGQVGKMAPPLVREMPSDMDTPISVFYKLLRLGACALFESVEGGEHMARYSFIGMRPQALLQAWPDRIVLTGTDGGETRYDPRNGHVLDVLRTLLPRYEAPLPADLPRFTGGALGTLSYDLVRCFERLPDAPPDTLGLPLATLALCDRVVACDHLKHRLLVMVHERPADTRAAARMEAESAMDEILECLAGPLPPAEPAVIATAAIPPMQSAFSREAYEQAVRKAREYIAAGDIFQVVPSRRIHRATTTRPLDLYRALRRVNPSPYMFYLDLPDGLKLVGSSPEMLVRVEDGVVTSRPLAGTRPRGATPEEDRALEVELLADPKERAEHVMLVDLARNDLGRVCAYGSVHTPLLMAVERYSHVMHIVSTVEGQLAEGRDALDALQAAFPAGTLSGAPKVRAMEIIDELEPERRGPYGGAVGYLGYSGNLDTCITIRTFVIKGQDLYLQSGGGVVADSDPETEYQETENKLRALTRALELAEGQPATAGGAR
ncbi:MAG: anthranilate synthase component I [Anaerolineae bacterium]